MTPQDFTDKHARNPVLEDVIESCKEAVAHPGIDSSYALLQSVNQAYAAYDILVSRGIATVGELQVFEDLKTLHDDIRFG